MKRIIAVNQIPGRNGQESRIQKIKETQDSASVAGSAVSSLFSASYRHDQSELVAGLLARFARAFCQFSLEVPPELYSDFLVTGAFARLTYHQLHTMLSSEDMRGFGESVDDPTIIRNMFLIWLHEYSESKASQDYHPDKTITRALKMLNLIKFDKLPDSIDQQVFFSDLGKYKVRWDEIFNKESDFYKKDTFINVLSYIFENQNVRNNVKKVFASMNIERRVNLLMQFLQLCETRQHHSYLPSHSAQPFKQLFSYDNFWSDLTHDQKSFIASHYNTVLVSTPITADNVHTLLQKLVTLYPTVSTSERTDNAIEAFQCYRDYLTQIAQFYSQEFGELLGFEIVLQNIKTVQNTMTEQIEAKYPQTPKEAAPLDTIPFFTEKTRERIWEPNLGDLAVLINALQSSDELGPINKSDFLTMLYFHPKVSISRVLTNPQTHQKVNEVFAFYEICKVNEVSPQKFLNSIQSSKPNSLMALLTHCRTNQYSAFRDAHGMGHDGIKDMSLFLISLYNLISPEESFTKEDFANTLQTLQIIKNTAAFSYTTDAHVKVSPSKVSDMHRPLVDRKQTPPNPIIAKLLDGSAQHGDSTSHDKAINGLKSIPIDEQHRIVRIINTVYGYNAVSMDDFPAADKCCIIM